MKFIIRFFKAPSTVQKIERRVEELERQLQSSQGKSSEGLAQARLPAEALSTFRYFFRPDVSSIPRERMKIDYTLDALMRLLPSIEKRQGKARILLKDHTLLSGTLVIFRYLETKKWIGYLYVETDVPDSLKGAWQIGKVYKLKLEDQSLINLLANSEIDIYVWHYDETEKCIILWDSQYDLDDMRNVSRFILSYF